MSEKVEPVALQRLKQALLSDRSTFRPNREIEPDVGRWRILCYQQLVVCGDCIQAKDAAGLAIELSRDEGLVERDPAEVARGVCRLLEKWQQASRDAP